MATSGTASINFDIREIFDEVYERLQTQVKTGYDITSATRSLNILTLDWANRGVHLWAMEQGTVTFNGSASYSLPADTIDVADVLVRTGTGSDQRDRRLARYGSGDWFSIPSKNDTGEPLAVWPERVVPPKLWFWPKPSSGTAVYYRMRRIQDAGTSIANTMDVPPRFLPALISGLTFYIAEKRAPQLVAQARLKYEEDLDRALAEDRDRSSLTIVPDMRG